MKDQRVVITGMGVVSPIGTSISEFWDALTNGENGITYFEVMQQMGCKCSVAGVPTLSPEDVEYVEIFNAKRYSSALQYALLATIRACKEAKIPVTHVFENNVNYNLGIIIGSLSANTDLLVDFYENYLLKKRQHKYRMSVAETTMNSGISTFIAGISGAGNIVLSTSNACSSGTEALVLAYDHIRAGKATQMIAGGAEAVSFSTWWSLYDAMRVIGSDSNDNPERASRPMNASVNGFIPAGGAGILVLENMNHALKRGAYIYAEIIGSSILNGAQRNGGTMSAPNCEATVRCIQNAIADAGIDSVEIDYLCGHLTSTMADVLEIKNWAKALKRYGDSFPMINTIKGMTGHCIGAAGAIETIAAVMQMNHSLIHPNRNCYPLHPEILNTISPDCIPTEAIKKEIKYCAKLSLGFGDTNACLILKKFNNKNQL